MTYLNSSDDPSGLSRTVGFTVRDAGGSSCGDVSRTVNVTPVNDAPVVTTSGGSTGLYRKPGRDGCRCRA